MDQNLFGGDEKSSSKAGAAGRKTRRLYGARDTEVFRDLSGDRSLASMVFCSRARGLLALRSLVRQGPSGSRCSGFDADESYAQSEVEGCWRRLGRWFFRGLLNELRKAAGSFAHGLDGRLVSRAGVFGSTFGGPGKSSWPPSACSVWLSQCAFGCAGEATSDSVRPSLRAELSFGAGRRRRLWSPRPFGRCEFLELEVERHAFGTVPKTFVELVLRGKRSERGRSRKEGTTASRSDAALESLVAREGAPPSWLSGLCS